MAIIFGNFFFKRILGRFCLSLSLGYILFHIYLGTTHLGGGSGISRESILHKLYFFVENNLKSLEIFAPELMASCLIGLGILFIINLLFIPILGVSLPDYLSGVRLKSNGLIFRSYVSFYLDGLFLFFIPIGEKITKLPLKIKSGTISFILTILFLSFLAMLAPFLSLMDFSGNMRMISNVIPPIKLDNIGNFENFVSYESERFQMEALSNLDNGRYILIPSYDVLSYSGKNSYIAKIIFYDLLGQTAGELKAEKTFNMREFLQVFAKYNPIFKIHYPTLFEFLQNPKNEFLAFDFNKQIKELFNEIMATYPTDLLKVLFRWGPFSHNIREAREYLLSFSGSNLFTEGEFVTMGDTNFFRMRSVYRGQDLNLKDVFIALKAPTPDVTTNVITMSFCADERGMNSRDQLLKTFFSTAKWGNIHESLGTHKGLHIEKEYLTPFDILDYFLKEDLAPNVREKLDEYATKHFFDVARLSLKKEDENLKTIVGESVRRYLVIVKNKVKKALKSQETSQESSALKLYYFFEGLEYALSHNDLDYFNLTK